jgi:hypothetical protein
MNLGMDMPSWNLMRLAGNIVIYILLLRPSSARKTPVITSTVFTRRLHSIKGAGDIACLLKDSSTCIWLFVLVERK